MTYRVKMISSSESLFCRELSNIKQTLINNNVSNNVVEIFFRWLSLLNYSCRNGYQPSVYKFKFQPSLLPSLYDLRIGNFFSRNLSNGKVCWSFQQTVSEFRPVVKDYYYYYINIYLPIKSWHSLKPVISFTIVP